MRILVQFAVVAALAVPVFTAAPAHSESVMKRLMSKDKKPQQKTRSRRRVREHHPQVGRQGHPMNERYCSARRSMLTGHQRRLDAYEADLAGIDAEIQQLRARLSDLESRRRDVQADVTTTKSTVESAQASYNQYCEQSETCEQYEQLTRDLTRQNKPAEQELEMIRRHISENRKAVSALSRRIEPLRREYQHKQCNAMVPGETSQSTIDRCADIFSEWNRIQADINRYNLELPNLRSRYQQTYAQIENNEKRASTYESYLARNCSRSRQLVEVRKFRGVRDRARDLGSELSRLVEDVTRLRGVKITVTPR